MSGARPDGEHSAAELERLSRELLGRLGPVAAEARYAAPGSDAWSAIEVLAHVAEFVPYWADQAAAVAGRDDPGDRPFGRTHDDPARIAAVREHAKDPYEALARRLEEGTASAAATLRAIPADAWAQTAVHARRGTMSVEQIVRQFLIDHLVEHTEQAGAAVGRS